MLIDENIINYDIKPRVTFGIIQLPSDIIFEKEVYPLLSQIENINWRTQKLNYSFTNEEITKENFLSAKFTIVSAASTFIPKLSQEYGSIDIMGFACSSMSFTLGKDNINYFINKGYPNLKNVTDMASSIINAIKIFKLKNISLFTPYNNEIHNICKLSLSSEIEGLNIVSEYNLNINKDSIVSSITPDSIINIIKNIVNDDTEIILICCSALRTTEYGFIDKLEGIFNKPVITSNQAFLWNLLSISDISKEEISKIKGYGILFKH
tara:strand:+ start:190 stop:987 length:798 start_codon:yes stop_codon:yes gene_type:complete